MHKCITFLCNVFFLLTSATVLADTNSDLNDCLSASQSGTNKMQCVTNVVNEAQKKSKDQMIETYTNFVQESMSSGAAVSGLTTKPGVQPKVQPPPTSAVPQAQPTQQQPPPPSKPPGGIQYY
jgi:hypothetical protein